MFRGCYTSPIMSDSFRGSDLPLLPFAPFAVQLSIVPLLLKPEVLCHERRDHEHRAGRFKRARISRSG